MTLFSYLYLDSKGKKRLSRIEASSEAEAKELLRRQHVLLLSFIQKKRFFFNKKVHSPFLTQKQLHLFTTQLSHLLSAGLPLYESLMTLEEQYRAESFHPIFVTLAEKIKAGQALSQALSLFPKSFSALYCSMIQAGETTGNLVNTLENLALYLFKQLKLKKQLTTALLYPLLLGGFAIGVVILLMTFVVPSLEMIFEERPTNGFTSVVITFSHILKNFWGLYIPLTLAILTFVFFFLKTSKGILFKNKILLKIPILKHLLVHASMARFCRTMGTLLQGGVTLLSALKISKPVIKNSLLEAIIEKAEEKIVEGTLLSVELKKSSLIPSLIPRMLAIGEEGGNLSTMFQKIAEVYEDETDKILTRISTLAQPVILIVMGTIIAVIMFAVLLPLTDISTF